MIYDKPATTVDEQIALLQSRGMRVPDRQRAAHYLRHIGYYRINQHLKCERVAFAKTVNQRCSGWSKLCNLRIANHGPYLGLFGGLSLFAQRGDGKA